MEVVRQKLIGLSIEISNAKNRSLIGLDGKIIDETKNTIIIKNSTIKTLIKNQITMKINVNNEPMELNGMDLIGRPEEIIKK